MYGSQSQVLSVCCRSVRPGGFPCATAARTTARTAGMTKSVTRRNMISPLPLDRGRNGIGRDDDCVRDLDDLVHRELGALRMGANRLGAGGLVDADRADAAVELVEDVAADPGDLVGRLVALGLGACGRLLEILGRAPAVPAQDHVGVQCASSQAVKMT